ncbi:YrbL family protein [Sulfitobacter sp.]|uniref:YrbL family protein n=1 Tax=Sulfitobacter sp. TaxID=1903071 RepID=UPI003FCD9CA6
MYLPQPLKISHLTWVAKGAQRLVILHPNRADLILKLPYVGELNGRLMRNATIPEKAINRHALRERNLYRRLGPAFTYSINHAPIPRYYGPVVTDLGVADAYEGIFNKDHRKLGMTFGQVIKRNLLSDEVLSDINEFVARLDRSDIPATDINASNIVYGYRKGTLVFVLVDGFGDYRSIPLESWFRRIRRRRTSTAYSRIAKRFDLVWNDQIRQFRD